MLTAKAEQRLQISTVPVERKTLPRVLRVGGMIVVPDGARIAVTAPVTGTLRVSASAASAAAGSTVEQGSVMYQLQPLLSPEREIPTAAERVAMASARADLVAAGIVADGDARQSKAELDAAQIALGRAQTLLAERVGSQRDVDDAVARTQVAMKALEAATERSQLLQQLTLDVEQKATAAIPIIAPFSGVLQTMLSSPGQAVSAGDVLFELVNLQQVWVRVGMYPGRLAVIDRESPVQVSELGNAEDAATAVPVTAPPTADPLSASVDLYYAVSNEDRRFHPNERVEVVVPLSTDEETLVIPRASVLRDIHGTAWVYVRRAEQTFERQRVEVQFTTADLSVLSRGPAPGTEVVVDGAAELFGTEFGAGK